MSSLTLERLSFNPADVAAGPSVGSYQIDAAGNVLSPADVGVHAEDAASVSGDKGVLSLVVRKDAAGTLVSADGDYSALQVDASGQLRTVTSFSSAVADDTPDTENPIKVGSHVRADGSALPASTAGDKVDLSSDLYRRVLINDAAHIGVLASAVTVGTSAVALPASALAGRTRMMIQNRGGQSIFVGHSTVTTATGIEVTKGATLALEAGPAVAFYAISGSAGNDVRVVEFG